MSGIFGEIGLHDPAPSPGAVGVMADRLAENRAQAEGLCIDRSSILGYRRTRSGARAAGRPDSRVDDRLGLSVVLDGSLYNAATLRARLEREGYAARSESHAEVVLHAFDAWGARCVERLDGAFAFVIRDRRRQRTLLARDPLGIRPLYYTRNLMRLRFASSLPALAAACEGPPTIDPVALHHYLSFGGVAPPPRTLVADIRKIPPATVFAVGDDGRSTSFTYWVPQSGAEAGTTTRAAGGRHAPAAAEPDSPPRQLLRAVAGTGMGQAPARGDPGGAADRAADGDADGSTAADLWRCVAALSEPVACRDLLAHCHRGRRAAAEGTGVLVSDCALERLAGAPCDGTAGETAATTACARQLLACDHDAICGMLQPEWLGADHSRALLARHLGRPGAPAPLDRLRRFELTALQIEPALRGLEAAAAVWGLELRLLRLDHRFVGRAAGRRGARLPALQGRPQGSPRGNASGPTAARGPDPAALDPAELAFMREALRRPASRSWSVFRAAFLERMLAEPAAHVGRTGVPLLWPIALLDAWRQAHAI